jgi:hypothetical protein
MKTRTNGSRTALLVGGALSAFVGLGAGIGGGALVWAHSTQRNADGFYATSAERLSTSSFAMTSPELHFGTEVDEARWVPGSDDGITALVEATGAGGRPVFVGIARRGDVDRYLAGSAHEEVTDFDVSPFRAEYRRSPGETRPPAPGTQSFWVASAEGNGAQRVTSSMNGDDLTVVVMNADGSPGVTADVAIGAKTGVLFPIGVGLLALATIGLGLGTVAIVAGSTGSRGRGRPGPSGTGNTPTPGASGNRELAGVATPR